MGKSFTTAVREITADDAASAFPYDFEIDGRKVRYRKPGDGEALLVVAAGARHTKLVEKLAAVVNLFTAVLQPGDREYIIDRLYDPADAFGSLELFGPNGDDGILADMLEEWSGHPTQS